MLHPQLDPFTRAFQTRSPGSPAQHPTASGNHAAGEAAQVLSGGALVATPHQVRSHQRSDWVKRSGRGNMAVGVKPALGATTHSHMWVGLRRGVDHPRISAHQSRKWLFHGISGLPRGRRELPLFFCQAGWGGGLVPSL